MYIFPYSRKFFLTWHKTCLLIESNIFTPSIIKSNKEINLCSIINVSLFHLIWEWSRHSMNIHHLILLKIPFLSPHVTGIRVLGFPKREIKRKPQKNFQTDFIKLMLEHRGDSTEERKVLQTGSGPGSIWLLS